MRWPGLAIDDQPTAKISGEDDRSTAGRQPCMVALSGLLAALSVVTAAYRSALLTTRTDEPRSALVLIWARAKPIATLFELTPMAGLRSFLLVKLNR